MQPSHNTGVGWVPTLDIAARVAPLLLPAHGGSEDVRLHRAALVVDCLASCGVLAMGSSQPAVSLNLKARHTKLRQTLSLID